MSPDEMVPRDRATELRIIRYRTISSTYGTKACRFALWMLAHLVVRVESSHHLYHV